MQLIDNAGTVAKKAWSVRLAALTAFLSALQAALPAIIDAVARNDVFGIAGAVLPMLSGYLQPDVLTMLTTLTALLTIVARLVAQPAMAAKVEDGSK